ncbi:hypothetical protein [Paenibacillus sp. FSL H8-0332]|uniref:hypothetical protein n=1 Tax=Paenibacillus sp. FSL H8-0332 TaxID=2954742 RepID=UPI0030D0A212
MDTAKEAVPKADFLWRKAVVIILNATKSEQSSDSPVIGGSLLCFFGHGWLFRQPETEARRW